MSTKGPISCHDQRSTYLCLNNFRVLSYTNYIIVNILFSIWSLSIIGLWICLQSKLSSFCNFRNKWFFVVVALQLLGSHSLQWRLIVQGAISNCSYNLISRDMEIICFCFWLVFLVRVFRVFLECLIISFMFAGIITYTFKQFKLLEMLENV